MFMVQNAPRKGMELRGLRVKRLERETGTEKFDVTVAMRESEGGIEGAISYNTDLFDQVTIKRMARHYQMVLEEVVRKRGEVQLSEISFLSEGERQQLLVEWNDTGRVSDLDRCVHELVERQVRETPDAIAVVHKDASLSYEKMNQRANQMARYLSRIGVEQGEVVGICIERSLEMVVGLLGVLKTGGAYLPLGLENPDERLRFIIEDTEVRVVITKEEQASRIEELSCDVPKRPGGNGTRGLEVISVDRRWEEISEETDEDRIAEAEGWPEKLAYVMYTSGTTGRPKGIAVKDRGVVRLVRNVDYAELNEKQVFLQYAPISFDASTFEIWGSLLNGGRLVVAP
jgi:non-ribosomal peptide synthetase component F